MSCVCRLAYKVQTTIYARVFGFAKWSFDQYVSSYRRWEYAKKTHFIAWHERPHLDRVNNNILVRALFFCSQLHENNLKIKLQINSDLIALFSEYGCMWLYLAARKKALKLSYFFHSAVEPRQKSNYEFRCNYTIISRNFKTLGLSWHVENMGTSFNDFRTLVNCLLLSA